MLHDAQPVNPHFAPFSIVVLSWATTAKSSDRRSPIHYLNRMQLQLLHLFLARVDCNTTYILRCELGGNPNVAFAPAGQLQF